MVFTNICKFFGTVLILSLGMAGQGMSQDFGFCWAEKDLTRICKPAEPMRSDFPTICRNFAVEEQAGYYGYRYSSDLETLETSMGQHCDEVRDGGVGNIFSCLLEYHCPERGESGQKNLSSKVYSTTQEQALNRCARLNSSKVLRELIDQSLLGCFSKMSLEIYQTSNSLSL